MRPTHTRLGPRIVARIIGYVWKRRVAKYLGRADRDRPETNPGPANLHCLFVAQEKRNPCDHCREVMGQVLDIVVLVAANGNHMSDHTIRLARLLVAEGLPTDAFSMGRYGTSARGNET